MNIRHFADVVLIGMDWAILVYFVFVNTFYALLLVSASWELRRHTLGIRGAERWRLLGSGLVPRISILAPAYNEEASAEESIRSLLAISYPDLEIVVINDGSKDATLQVLRDRFDLVPVDAVVEPAVKTKPVRGVYRSRAHGNLVVVDKENGGKADALNVGLNVAGGDLVCAIDADTLIEPDALQRMVQPFLERSDTLAAGGTVRVANGAEIRNGRVLSVRAPREYLAGIQAVEYLRAFLFGRLGWNRLGGNLIISGAFGLFRRDAVLAAGGYAHDTVGEDIELVLRLRRHAYEAKQSHQVAFVPDPVAWTEVPVSTRVLSRQRDRWHRGLADVMWRHRVVLFNPKYGAMGWVAFPYFIFVELFAPILEMLGLLGTLAGMMLGLLNIQFAILFFLLAYGYGVLLTLATLMLEETSFRRYVTLRDRLILIGWALVENLGYRQRTVIWRLKGIIKYMRGMKDWGAMERRGLVKPPT
jgi:cellulose synthase/poly-beta-1,6-N-acetylglucosamine synthase-like glycosyltransferase